MPVVGDQVAVDALLGQKLGERVVERLERPQPPGAIRKERRPDCMSRLAGMHGIEPT
jgi:hypothetical protein